MSTRRRLPRSILVGAVCATTVLIGCSASEPVSMSTRPTGPGEVAGTPEPNTTAQSGPTLPEVTTEPIVPSPSLASTTATEPTDDRDDHLPGHDIPPGVSVCWSAEPAVGTGIALERATSEFGLVAPLVGMHGHAVAAADVSGNGWTDLFVAGFADRPADRYQVRGATGPSPDRLLLGGPDGFRVDTSFPGELARTSGATFVDLDNNGSLELVVVRNPRGDGEIGRRPTTVYRQADGDWVAATTMLPDVAGRAVAAVDVDRDGLVDLVVVADRWGGGSTRFLRNLGGLQFEDATSEWGVPDDLTGLAVATVDLDGDGWLDVVVSGDARVLMGGPDGFRVERHEVLTWEPAGNEDDAAGIAVGDLDGDGRPDLVVGQHFNSTLDFGERVPVRIFLNRTGDDGLHLVDVTAASGSPGLWTKSPHVAIVDLDNDGWPDIVTSATTARGAPFVLRGLGIDADGVPQFAPIGEPGDGRYWVTGAEFDLDHDGRIDLFQMEWEPSEESPMFRNMSASGHWLQVDLTGSFGAAAGTQVDVIDQGTGDRLASAWVASSTGYAGGARPVVHFGLGDRPSNGVVEVAVTPVGGSTTRYTLPIDANVALAGC